ncbi:MAG: hypothetical protein Q8O00_04360, partial [Holophaga sp.]|nr:hypothetical protein [Holophaga sp.]
PDWAFSPQRHHTAPDECRNYDDRIFHNNLLDEIKHRGKIDLQSERECDQKIQCDRVSRTLLTT